MARFDRNIRHHCSEIISYKGLVRQSMDCNGNCCDNVVLEPFFKSLKVEWAHRHSYGFRSEAELSIFQWIETWYNNGRRHSFLGNRTIKEFEIDMYNLELAELSTFLLQVHIQM